MGKEGEKGGASQGEKGVPRREEAGTSYQGRGTGRRKETEENGGRKSGVPCKGRSAARMKEELDRRVKKENGGTLWKGHSRRGTISRIRMVCPGNDSDIH